MEYQGKVDVQVVDVSGHRDLVERFRIFAIPTQIVFDTAGKELYRHEGFLAKEKIIDKLKELGLSL